MKSTDTNFMEIKSYIDNSLLEFKNLKEFYAHQENQIKALLEFSTNFKEILDSLRKESQEHSTKIAFIETEIARQENILINLNI